MVQIRRKGPKRSEHVGMQKGANFVPTNLSTENDDPFQDPSELGLECTLTWKEQIWHLHVLKLFLDMILCKCMQNIECHLQIHNNVTIAFKFMSKHYILLSRNQLLRKRKN